ncbi:MAG: hypothetical protein AAB453_03000 [Patescibacteria group bacterium]
MKNLYISNRLFVGPSFWEGMSRVIDLGGTLQEYNTSETEKQADDKAIGDDWQVVGDDLRSSIKNYEQQSAKSV